MDTLSQEQTRQPVEWSRTKLIAFRFAFAIAALTAHMLIHFAPYYLLPVARLSRPLRAALDRWNGLNFWANTSVGWFIIRALTGSNWTIHDGQIVGYRWYSHVLVLSDLVGVLLLAAFVAIVWTAIDRRRVNYSALNRAMRVYLRYALGNAMLGYAINKVMPIQFGILTPGEMLQPFGQLSHGSLLWGFMAASRGYQIFTGLVELTGVSLLFFRRTTLLGALILAGALTNIVAIDMGYQVGAVRYAIIFLLLDLILLAPYLPRLCAIVLGEGAGAFPCEPAALRRRWYHSPLAKAAILCLLASSLVYTNGIRWRHSQAAARVSGLFDVASFVRNGQSVVPLASDNATWKRVACDNRRGEASGWELSVQFADGDVRSFALTDDTVHRVWTIHDKDPSGAGSLHYAVQQDGDVSLDGRLGGKSVDILLHPVDAKKFFALLRPTSF
jgi:hypothetical protein